MKNKPNLKSVAKLAEVSVPTASQVMREQDVFQKIPVKKFWKLQKPYTMFRTAALPR